MDIHKLPRGLLSLLSMSELKSHLAFLLRVEKCKMQLKKAGLSNDVWDRVVYKHRSTMMDLEECTRETIYE